ncbi:MAG: DNA ligase-associated DEXH box helicase, partial [Balneolales bacterium]
IIFEVFQKHDPGNLLVKQTFREIMNFQLKETHLRRALERINHGKLLVKEPGKATPFAFPIMVDRLRDELTSEKLYDRIRRMQRQLQK